MTAKPPTPQSGSMHKMVSSVSNGGPPRGVEFLLHHQHLNPETSKFFSFPKINNVKICSPTAEMTKIVDKLVNIPGLISPRPITDLTSIPSPYQVNNTGEEGLGH